MTDPDDVPASAQIRSLLNSTATAIEVCAIG
jgi:hypothetical protein